jgi:hypothetical protein
MPIKNMRATAAPYQPLMHAQLLKRHHKVALALWTTRDKTHALALKIEVLIH